MLFDAPKSFALRATEITGKGWRLPYRLNVFQVGAK